MTENKLDPRLTCPNCQTSGSAWVNKCSKCGRQFSKQEIVIRQGTVSDGKQLIGCLGFVVAILFVGFLLFVPSKEKKARQSELAAVEKRAGKHCLSPLDSSNYYVNRYIAALLRNPDSYDHIKTNTASVGADGNHEFIVTYRAENGFGGKNIGSVIGKFSNASCEVVEAKLIPK